MGAYAAFYFKGTSVWIYGAKRDNHGEYTVELDTQFYPPIDGFSDVGLFQQVLFSAVELNDTGSHSLVIFNAYTDAARPYLDVDSVRILNLP